MKSKEDVLKEIQNSLDELTSEIRELNWCSEEISELNEKADEIQTLFTTFDESSLQNFCNDIYFLNAFKNVKIDIKFYEEVFDFTINNETHRFSCKTGKLER